MKLPTFSVHMHCTACGGSGVLGGKLCHCQDDLRSRIAQLEAREKVLREALKSIAANTCCGPCQEAALVARAALAAGGAHEP